MGIKRTDFESHIQHFRFKELFNQLGWDEVRKKETVAVNDQIFELEWVAEKRGFVVFVCRSASNGKMPDSAARKKIDRAITKLFFEHLIIFVDGERRTQIWQISIREPNKPIVTRETTHYIHQKPESIYQKLRGLLFTLEEEDRIGLVDVKQRVSESFNANADKVTKRFYDEFKKEHRKFLEFIEGIGEMVDRDWYASLMLNQLMFIYFIQKKGFLDNNHHYLRDKLKRTKQKRGRNQFYSFYRDFLLVLFHEGLGKPESQREQETREEIGKIPYLNGGLFEVHEIEKTWRDINIKDEAFEGIFDFFDQYHWHLDTSITATGRDINPDVIGYIFEKYINDRAAMGAYYTKEDITEYISKNCIIPYLFEETRKECANAFREDSFLWKMLRENPDRYIYEAVKHGVTSPLAPLQRGEHLPSSKGGERANPPFEGGNKRRDVITPEKLNALSLNQKIALGLPEEIAVGIDTTQPNLLERRKHWNTPAPPEVALPTETWREVIERRKRYWEIREKITKGEIRDINDFITYNLDIRQFAQDAVTQYEGSDFINAFYKAITKITVLDPTCGSGAFLFAALNILEPLYEACLERMKQFTADADAKDQAHPEGARKFPQFRKVLADIERHPNLKYYIYKSIILNNLYGVDIMKDAVEIAKLRLFLKLVAEVEDMEQVEPMPDIDYNIRAGNTLVGFATYKELQEAIQGAAQGKFDFGGEAEKFREEAEKVGMAFRRFQNAQLVEDSRGDRQGDPASRQAKAELQIRLSELNEKLNLYLAKQYGIDPAGKPEAYAQWKASHQPFHWFAEFYEIVHERGGFDVIIGNPPYVEYAQVRKDYSLPKEAYHTEFCGNLYAYICERGIDLIKENGREGMIIPISSVSTPRMANLIQYFLENSSTIHISNFAVRPGKLFVGADMNLTIYLLKCSTRSMNHSAYSTEYQRWYGEFRSYLFQLFEYSKVEYSQSVNSLPKIGKQNGYRLWEKLMGFPKLSSLINSNELSEIYYHSGGRYFRKCLLEKLSNEYKPLPVPVNSKYQILSLLSSSLYYWYWLSVSDTYHVTKPDILHFRIPEEVLKNKHVEDLGKRLLKDLWDNATIRERIRSDGTVQSEVNFYVGKSKSLIDEIDKVLAQHYGFTEEELDFIINYDIKYRMGKELAD